MNEKTNTILHGEAMIFGITAIPKSAKPLEVAEKQLIIAPSETTGNHHVVETAGCEFFKDEKTGTVYMNSPGGSTVSCVHTDRHSPIEIPAGIYEFGTQQEYDYLNEHLRKVAD